MDSDTTTPAALRLGPVRLAVHDLERIADFYAGPLGLRRLGTAADGTVALGTGDRPLVELLPRPGAPRAPRGTAGLFHLAVLVPGRGDLGDALARLAQAGATLSGASDHLVSEALYLNDPEGNGIEIYRDRPREEWPHRDGRLLMDTQPLDLDGVLSERSPGGPPAHVPDATALGHVHLRVDDLEAARRFYVGVLGLDVMVDTYPGALFVAAGGYHHHIGLNTWMSDSPAAGGALGLDAFTVDVDPATAESIASRVAGAAAAGEVDGGGALRLADPAGNRLVVRPVLSQPAATPAVVPSGAGG